MLQEGMNSYITRNQFESDDTKYIFRFNYDICIDFLSPSPNTKDELTESYNDYCDKYGIPCKIINVIELIGSVGWSLVTLETTKPMTFKRFNQIYNDYYSDNYNLILEEGIEIVNICD